MEPRNPRPKRPATMLALFTSMTLTVAVACGESPIAPGGGGDPDPDSPPDTVTPIEQLPVSSLTRDDLEATGTVVETEDGFTVDGTLRMSTSDTSEVTFANADLVVRHDAQGRVRSISGKAEIASPHERIEIEGPVRADVGFFPGKWLNENGEMGIVLQDDTDYFVFHLETRIQMNIATGETGEDAVRPVSVRAPVGGQVLMVVDYTDPMYYVYGEQDLLGNVGTGWSLNQRIPFRPSRPVIGIPDFGAFDGGAIRVGSFPIFKIVEVTGISVDNAYTELHMSDEDPLSSSPRAGYRLGSEGEAALDLGIKDMVGISLPLASTSSGVWADASAQDVFTGYYYAEGRTAEDPSWWPSFIPVKPATALAANVYVTSDARFEVGLSGTYGFEFPNGLQAMSGSFELSNDSMLLEGRVSAGEVVWALGGRVTEEETRVYFQPPELLMDEVAWKVNDEVLPRIEEAEAAWNDVREATEDYELELSLRGLRQDIPPMVDQGRTRLAAGVAQAIASQKDQLWEGDFTTKIETADNVYYEQLTQLRNAATNATDNATTRATLERELREMAARKTFTFTYSYSWFGQVLYSTTVTRTILTDTQANRLLQAADNVHRIGETSDIKVQMEQIYETVNERALFDDVRDDLEDGLLRMAAIDEMGFVVVHEDGSFGLYAGIAGNHYELGTISALTIEEVMKELPDAMLEALRGN